MRRGEERRGGGGVEEEEKEKQKKKKKKEDEEVQPEGPCPAVTCHGALKLTEVQVHSHIFTVTNQSIDLMQTLSI